ncbi:MAG: hypothetical protein C0617_13050 [Desulfuromonas sp.]|uniref:hypothetical protein n=1 Tax=Desulfuromonas sp. TaxID=892 RepID=UPI000CC21F5F|nr:hypothetical protein [Desulfuromonas sp.]PLX82797.1 MAG: hypothetical protein C0617_13050 [Desulfuromonas sp.]
MNSKKEYTLSMKSLLPLLPLLILLTLASPVLALSAMSPSILFSQEVIAIAPDGTPYPAQTIDPAAIPGMRTYDFDLGGGRALQICSNLADPESRGLNETAGVVQRSYRYIEAASGRTLERGVLLYIIEMERIPVSYRFQASYQEAQWGEVRLALVEPGQDLFGPNAAEGLTELIYDTIPHELGHDVLSGMPCMLHDLDGEASVHTRWFIEGICEVLAKGFAGQEDPTLLKRFMALRKVGTVLDDLSVRDQLFSWAQHNGNQMVLESDLYGAALLVMMAWTEKVELVTLLDRLERDSRSFCGNDLVALLGVTTGLGREEMIERASLLGQRIEEEIFLVKNEADSGDVLTVSTRAGS